jgi:hypothetical protein
MDSGSMKIPEKYRDIAKYAYSVLRQYPKSEKYTPAATIRLLPGIGAGEAVLWT